MPRINRLVLNAWEHSDAREVDQAANIEKSHHLEDVERASQVDVQRQRRPLAEQHGVCYRRDVNNAGRLVRLDDADDVRSIVNRALHELNVLADWSQPSRRLGARLARIETDHRAASIRAT